VHARTLDRVAHGGFQRFLFNSGAGIVGIARVFLDDPLAIDPDGECDDHRAVVVDALDARLPVRAADDRIEPVEDVAGVDVGEELAPRAGGIRFLRFVRGGFQPPFEEHRRAEGIEDLIRGLGFHNREAP
jgi:hypothetical protein